MVNSSNTVMYDTIEPCSDSGAFVAEPEVEVRLDLEVCEERLKEQGYRIKFSSEVILLVVDKAMDIEVGLYPSGKLLFKTTDKEELDEIMPEIRSMVLDLLER